MNKLNAEKNRINASHPIEYTIGNTTILRNPHGYINEKYNGYEPKFILEL